MVVLRKFLATGMLCSTVDKKMEIHESFTCRGTMALYHGCEKN